MALALFPRETLPEVPPAPRYSMARNATTACGSDCASVNGVVGAVYRAVAEADCFPRVLTKVPRPDDVYASESASATAKTLTFHRLDLPHPRRSIYDKHDADNAVVDPRIRVRHPDSAPVEEPPEALGPPKTFPPKKSTQQDLE